MPLIIDTPSSSWSQQDVTLGGKKYTFVYKYNSRDERWRLSISIGGTEIISSVKVMENQLLLGRYILPDFDHGDLACVRSEDDGKPVGKDNLGAGKPYELLYFTNEELAELE